MNRRHTEKDGRHKRQAFALPFYPGPFAVYSNTQHRLDSYTRVYILVSFSCISARVHRLLQETFALPMPPFGTQRRQYSVSVYCRDSFSVLLAPSNCLIKIVSKRCAVHRGKNFLEISRDTSELLRIIPLTCRETVTGSIP